MYVRPHELDLDRATAGRERGCGPKSIHINPAGSVVKVRLVADEFGLMLNVDISPGPAPGVAA